MSKSVVEKAQKYYRDGHVQLVKIGNLKAVFTVQGTTRYTVTFKAGNWQCTCPARTMECAHVLATRMWVEDSLKDDTDTLMEKLKKPSLKP